MSSQTATEQWPDAKMQLQAYRQTLPVSRSTHTHTRIDRRMSDMQIASSDKQARDRVEDADKLNFNLV